MRDPPSVKAAPARASFGVTRLEVRGFRSARKVALAPGPLCALVGEANAGKSNLLAAIRAVLDPAAAPLTAGDMAEGGDGRVSIRITLADGTEAALEGSPSRKAVTGADLPPTLFLPAEERARAVLAASTPRKNGPTARVFERELGQRSATPGAQALAILEVVESALPEYRRRTFIGSEANHAVVTKAFVGRTASERRTCGPRPSVLIARARA